MSFRTPTLVKTYTLVAGKRMLGEYVLELIREVTIPKFRYDYVACRVS